MIHSLLSASHVIEYHQDLSLDCESPDTIHWICEQLGAPIVRLNNLSSADMRADMMTKSLADKLHSKHMKSVVK